MDALGMATTVHINFKKQVENRQLLEDFLAYVRSNLVRKSKAN